MKFKKGQILINEKMSSLGQTHEFDATKINKKLEEQISYCKHDFEKFVKPSKL